jgi:hypothetical protein
MNALLAATGLALALIIIALVPDYGAPAVALCAACALPTALLISRSSESRTFLLRLFCGGLLARVFVGTLIYYFNVQGFFGGDAFTYDYLGAMTMKMWRGEMPVNVYQSTLGPFLARNAGMIYVNAATYMVVGQNMLAVQFLNAVAGAATAPIIYLCARRIFGNLRVARNAALFVAFFPSLILWSSQGLKDGPIVLLLALCVLAMLRLDERFSLKYLVVLVAALLGVLSMRFYVFYMMAGAVIASFVIGANSPTLMSYVRRFAALIIISLGLIQFGVLSTAGKQWEAYGNLEAVQRSRADLAESAKSGFGGDADVSTARGALTVIPLGMIYLLFAPFPWQLASLRQSITMPEMIVWWASFPLLCSGLWFTLKHKMRQALPVIIFTMMLTLAYSVFQGNIGTAYRQRSQLLIFYFIFVSVGYELVRERREDKKRGAATPQPARQPRQSDLLTHPAAAVSDFDERDWSSVSNEMFKGRPASVYHAGGTRADENYSDASAETPRVPDRI